MRPVLVMPLDHYGALGVMRSLGRLGVPVYGLHKDDAALALLSRWSRGGFVWNLDEEPAARSCERLLEIAHELGERPILLPTNDESALFVAAHAEELGQGFQFQDNPFSLVRGLYDKREMYFLAQDHGIPTPETLFPQNRDQLRAFVESVRFPVMLKGSDGIRLSQRSGVKMLIVDSAEELLERYDQLEDPAHPDLMLQEYIPGGEDAQWMFNGYFDGESECRLGVTGRKLRQTPPYTGMTSLGVCLPNPEVEALTRRFMKAVGYRGILDIGYRFDARDGRYKLLDVNPRLGATFRLFAADSGLDVARALYFDFTGQPLPEASAREGRTWQVEDLDFTSSLRYHADGRLSVSDWLRSLRHIDEHAWFARDDLRPFAGMCHRFVSAAARKVGRKIVPAPRQRQSSEVRDHFRQAASYWKRVYEEEHLDAVFYRERQAAALRWVEQLFLHPSADVLDVGCGAGHTAVALAQRGYQVHALDAVPEMLELAASAARAAGVRHFAAELGDVHQLRFSDESFDLVLALGVLPWLRSEALGVGEMARVLKPGGWLIATADNAAPLHRLLDPRSTPPLAPLRHAAKRLLRRGDDAELSRRHPVSAVDELVRDAGLIKVDAAAIGFGPFSLLGKRLFSQADDARLQHQLQRLARWPILRSTGAHYAVLARKPEV